MSATLMVPSVSESDLLAFQLLHFADETKPDHWFIDAETALNFQPEVEADDLGYYDDGVERTLTDEQIAMFRHTEEQELSRERRLQREEQEYQARDVDSNQGHVSPVSSVPTLEEHLLDMATIQSLRPKPEKRQISQSSRSDTSRSTGSSAKRRRKREVPYGQRKKRNWEKYIEGEDERHGSLTQRRLVRELDEQRQETVNMDYGDDEPTQARPKPAAVASVRRQPVSYEDV